MEWMCAECGAPHPKNDPPCKNCGAMRFEKTVVRRRPDDATDPASIEWECTECGRTHPKNNPPCSRCGNMQLESVPANQFDDELSSGFELRDAAKFAGALAVVAVLLFAAVNAGVLDRTGTPTVENVPGEANESSGLELSAVEYRIHDDVNRARSSDGAAALSLEPGVTEMAAYYNKLMVKRGEHPLEESSDAVFEGFGACSDPGYVTNRVDYDHETDERAIDHYATEAELASEFSESWLGYDGTRPILLDESVSSIGVDVHVAENGDVYAAVVLC